GRTPGKRMVGIEIIATDGSAPGVGAILTRNVFRLIDSFPGAYAVGLIATMATRNGVRIGDMAAGTLLVYARAEALPLPAAGEQGDRWQNALARMKRLGRRRTEDALDAAAMADDYRMLAHDVANVRPHVATTDAPKDRAREYLEAAYAQAHAVLHK